MSESKIGHNSAPADINNVAGARLLSIIQRIERLEEEKKALSDDIKDIKTEAKSAGFDTKIIAQVLRIRKQDQTEREMQDQLRDTYLRALGMY